MEAPIRSMSLRSSSSTSTSESSSRMSTESNGPAPSIYLLNAMPSTMPRSSPPTPQRLILVATLLTNYLAEKDLPHAYLGRFALFLRGASYSPKWIDVEIGRPTMVGASKVKEILSAHPDFEIHTSVESQHDSVSKSLVSHKSGIYFRVSIGYGFFIILAPPVSYEPFHSTISNLRRKTIQISARSTESHAPSLLPLLTPARHFLETVIMAASSEGKEEDAQDLMWMHEHLRVELLSDGSTLKKTWDENRLQTVVKMYPIISKTIWELGLATLVEDDGSKTVVSTVAQLIDCQRLIRVLL